MIKPPNLTSEFTTEDAELLAELLGEKLESADAPPPLAQDPVDIENGWQPDLNPTQRKIFDDPSENILGHGEKGCRTGDTMVYTDCGLKRLISLKPKDAKSGEFTPICAEVISFCGSGFVKTQADSFWVEPDTAALRADLSNGAEIIGSHRHPIWVCWQDLVTLQCGFCYSSLSEIKGGISGGKRYWTPFVSHAMWGSVYKTVAGCELTPDLAYAIGALVGDGALNIFTGDNRSVGFTNCDQECLDAVRNGLSQINCTLTQVRSRKFQYLVSGKAIKPLIKELGIGCLSYFKRIPDQIVESPKEVICSFLSGLFDTDGTVEKIGLVSLCTVSEGLGKDVQDILAALGILCVRRYKKSASLRPTWTLSMMGKHAHQFGELIGFKITRKQTRIVKPKYSTLCPLGFNQNRYGYPDPIRQAMKNIALASRTDIRKPREGVLHRDRKWHNDHRHLHSFGSIPSRSKVDSFSKLYDCSTLNPFLLCDNWLEIVDVKETKAELFDLHVPATHSFLASGTINHNSGKSIGFGHKVIRHAYENNNALVLIITPMIRTGNEGIWHDLETLILPKWQDGIGLEYTPSRLDPLTKDRHRWIRNRHGGWSKLLLMSIPHASQVQQRVKGPAPSMVYVDELTECDGRDYWEFTAAQLGRRRDIEGPQQFLASCNAKGPSHWVYQVFFVEKVDEKGNPKPGYAVYHVPIQENLKRLPSGYVERLKSIFEGNQTEWKRLIDGEWIDTPTGEGIFKPYYLPDIHLKGDLIKRTGLEPKRGFPIYIGYDIGQRWQGITFMQAIPTSQKTVWIIFDECDHLGERILYKVLALEVVSRMRFWRRKIAYPFQYCHITDESALNQWRPGGEGSYDAWEFEREFNRVVEEFGRVGADGNVEPAKMLGCPKGPGSVAARVRLVQSKLYQEELFISAQCENTVNCMNNLEKDKDDPTKPKRSPYLHKFDSLSYVMFKVEIGGDPRLLLPISQQAPPARLLRIG